MSTSRTDKLFFATLPDLTLLRGFKATHDVLEPFGIQPSCCRELLFTMPDVLVSPAFDNQKDLFIIAEVSIASSQSFLCQLNKMQIKLCSRLDVDSEFFQYCLTYSIYQKLAPFWNKTGSFLAQGRCFLQECEKFSAIRSEITVTDKICLALEPFLVKMQPPLLEDFVVDFQALWNFKRNKNFAIMSVSIQDLSCYVLPSLKVGKVHSITHDIPLNAPFRSYDDMRQHWKIMYGYRLPSGTCEMFFNIKFFGSTIFTYPEWCVRKFEPIKYLRCDHDAICKQFLQDLFTRMPSICGSSLHFTKESLYWQKSLLSADMGSKSFLIKSFPKLPYAQVHTLKKRVNSTDTQRGHGFQYTECSENDRNNPYNLNLYDSKNCLTNNDKLLCLQNEKKRFYHFLNHDTNNSERRIQQRLSDSNTVSPKNNIIDIPDSPFVNISPYSEHNLTNSFTCNETSLDKINDLDVSHKEELDISGKSSDSKNQSDCDLCVVPDVKTNVKEKLTDNEFVNRGDFAIKKVILSELINSEINMVEKHRVLHMIHDVDKKNHVCFSNKRILTERVSDDSVVPQGYPHQQVVTEECTSIADRGFPQKTIQSPKNNSRIVPSFMHKSKSANKCVIPVDRSFVLNMSTNCSSKLKPSFLPKNLRQTVIKSSAQISLGTKRIYHSESNVPISESNLLSCKSSEASVNICEENSSELRSIKNKIITTTPHKKRCAGIDTMRESSLKFLKVPKFTSNIKKQKAEKKVQAAQTSVKTSDPREIDKDNKQLLIPPKQQVFDHVNVLQVSESKPSLINCSIINQSQSAKTLNYNALSHLQTSDSITMKKQRSKPKVQDVDVECMARKKMLGKVNLVTLKSWLIEKGVSYKSSEKKELLIQKVEIFLNIQNKPIQQVEKFVSTSQMI